jgi:hypothetical protein
MMPKPAIFEAICTASNGFGLPAWPNLCSVDPAADLVALSGRLASLLLCIAKPELNLKKVKLISIIKIGHCLVPALAKKQAPWCNERIYQVFHEKKNIYFRGLSSEE